MKVLGRKLKVGSKPTERFERGRVPVLPFLLIGILGVLSFSVTDVRGQGSPDFVAVPITADSINANTPIKGTPLDAGSNNFYSPHNRTTHGPGTGNWDTRWEDEKDRECPFANANKVPNDPDTGCGFGDALSIAGWTVRNNSDVCPDEQVKSIRVQWDIIHANKNNGDSDGLLVSMFDNSANRLRDINQIPGGGGLYVRDKTGDKSKYIVKGSGEPGISDPPYKEVTGPDVPEIVRGADDGDGTLGFKLVPGGSLTVADILNRFTVYQWRDQSAGGYSGGNYELGRVITAPIKVDLIFDHEPRRAPCTPPPPVNYPYLQIEGSNVISGANFTFTGVCEPTADALGDSANANVNTNGFHGNGLAESSKGSSNAQYGVWSSGDIGVKTPGSNTFRANFGYRRDQSSPNDDIRDSLFANTNWTVANTENGNFYDSVSSNPSLPCIDVSADIAAAGTPVSGLAGTAEVFLGSLTSGSLMINGSQDIGDINIAPDVDKTILVNGDLTIGGDIKYPDDYTASDIPNIKIIASNIFIKQNTKRIDANLVAFPQGEPLTKGIIDTCSDMVWRFPVAGDDVAIPGEWPANGRITTDSCKNGGVGLKINGSLTARRILFKRTHGTLGTKAAAADDACYFANYSSAPDASNPPVIDSPDDMVERYEKCAAELIDSSPETHISELNDNPPQTIQFIPVSTLELPPIF